MDIAAPARRGHDPFWRRRARERGATVWVFHVGELLDCMQFPPPTVRACIRRQTLAARVSTCCHQRALRSRRGVEVNVP